MTILVHLSDTHFGTQVPAVVAAVQAAVMTIKPDIVTISGDITQRARPDEFRQAKQFLEGLAAHVTFVIPGNHDIPLFNIPLRLFNPYYHYSRVFGERDGVWCVDNIGLIGYNATSRWRHTRGLMLEADLVARIEQARSRLKPGALLIACAHQPLAVAWPEDAENRLINHAYVAEAFAKYGVDLVLSGHVHVPLIETSHRAFPALPRHFILSGAGTAVSCRTRPGAPNSFHVVEITRGAVSGIRLTLMEFDAVSQAFHSTLSRQFFSSPAGWVLH
jgi:3',5'-cyclic AMP phosphodiesterase CpdA